MKGSVLKRCSCPPQRGARGDRLACKQRHGSWYFVADCGVDPATRKRRQVKRGGFATKSEAEAALTETLNAASTGLLANDGRQSTEAYLTRWLDDKERNGLRPTTMRSYRAAVERYIVPTVGNVRLRDLATSHVEAVLAAVPAGRRTTAVRVHATLRSALATARRQRLVSVNVAVDADIPRPKRAKVRPWEPEELGRFLDHVAGDPLGPLFELIAATGLRRGEARGLRWSDVDFERRELVVRQQLVQVTTSAPCPSCPRMHRGLSFGPPKTASSEARNVELDDGAVGVLLAHRLTQDEVRRRLGVVYADHGLVFGRSMPTDTREKPRWLPGEPIAPERVTKRFVALCAELDGLPRIRLHDLRHGQASLMLAAGVPMAVVSKRLGHSTVSITSDTYSHLLEGVGRQAAERAMALVPRGSSTLPSPTP